ncbi:MAG TPA: hypothetical protein VMK32_10015 [Burkholderiaceae bacterium]|nr:hypothetical protein [Burkholderiaceae bacterium]
MAGIGEELKQLFDRNLQANLKLLDRAGSVLRDAGRATRDPERLRGADTRSLVSELLQLQLDYYARLSEQSLQYMNAVVSLAESVVSAPARVANTTASATLLSGKPGETVVFQFRLDNPNDRPLNAAIESREWLSRDGQRVGADTMSFDPAATVIEPKSSRTVVGRVTIDDRFAPGGAYDTLIRVAGFPGREVAITLAVAGLAAPVATPPPGA